MTEEEALVAISNIAPGSDMLSNSIRGLGKVEFKINLNKGKTVEESLRIATKLIGEKLDEIAKEVLNK